MAIFIKQVEGENVYALHSEVNPGFELKKNVTRSWKKAGSPNVGTIEFENFAEEMLKKHLLNTDKSGGFYIVKNQSKSDSKKRPYTVDKNVNSEKRKFITAYQLTGKTTKVVYEKALIVKQSGAISIATQLCKAKKEDIEIDIIKVCVEGVSNIANVKYTPSVSFKKGEFVIFGRIEGIINM